MRSDDDEVVEDDTVLSGSVLDAKVELGAELEREGAAELENASDSAVLAVVVDENVDDAKVSDAKEDNSTVELSSDGKSSDDERNDSDGADSSSGSSSSDGSDDSGSDSSSSDGSSSDDGGSIDDGSDGSRDDSGNGCCDGCSDGCSDGCCSDVSNASSSDTDCGGAELRGSADGWALDSAADDTSVRDTAAELNNSGCASEADADKVCEANCDVLNACGGSALRKKSMIDMAKGRLVSSRALKRRLVFLPSAVFF